MNDQIDLNDLRTAVTSAASRQDLDVSKAAVICELGDRVVEASPSLWTFLVELADLSDAGARIASDRGTDQVPWVALSQLLRDAARRHRDLLRSSP